MSGGFWFTAFVSAAMAYGFWSAADLGVDVRLLLVSYCAIGILIVGMIDIWKNGRPKGLL